MKENIHKHTLPPGLMEIISSPHEGVIRGVLLLLAPMSHRWLR